MKLFFFLTLVLVANPLRAEIDESELRPRDSEWGSLGVTLSALTVLGIVIGVVSSNSSSD